MCSFAGKTHTKDQYRIWPLSPGARPACLPALLLPTSHLPLHHCSTASPSPAGSSCFRAGIHRCGPWTKSISIAGDLSGMHTLRLSPRLQNQELWGERGRIYLPVQQPSRGCVWVLVLGTPGSRALSTPLPGTCSSSFESCFNLDFRSFSFHAIHFPAAQITVGHYR